ncbi:MAG: AmmeMemoRadiSam system protein A [Candidatus Competibacterales bacterium]|nr:AmmeMemoRadiSam system protein A [Candidatus Competibacterales bacterium]
MYTDDERALLLEAARESIGHGLDRGRALPLDPRDYPQRLREPRASFVTLEIEGTLRGCIGALEAYQPLIADVAEHAFAAAFHDPRFPPLAPPELSALELHISVLGLPEPLDCAVEEELLAQLRPGIDGLILECGRQRATFLPTVWESLPEPRQFLAHLRRKAGLAPDYWSERIRWQRYQVEAVTAG